jgi:phenylpyruvate tautomerase PptA (4-oxalocrotonate tautomerase family)
MPIVFVTDTQTQPETRVREMLKSVNQAVSGTLGVSPGVVWVRYDPGNPDFYWEGEDGKVPGNELPVFVSVRLTQGRDREKLRQLFPAVSSAIGEAFQMEAEAVWIRLEEMDPDHAGQGPDTYTDLRKKK